MKRIIATLLLVLSLCSSLHAQRGQDFLQRYNLLVSRVGFAGIGIDNLLNNWYKADSLDVNVMIARFNYYYALSERDTIIQRTSRRYLGMDPIMTLKDSSGRDVGYFKEAFYDETLFGKALSHLDKAIALDNTRLDLCILRANTLLAFEKASPDLTLAYLKELAAKNYGKSCKWTFPDKELEEGFFTSLMQDYCYEFYKLSTPGGYEAFRSLSEAMMKYEPKQTSFVNNVGSYHLVVKGKDKVALRYYKKALKIDPEDKIARKNISIIEARAAKKK